MQSACSCTMEPRRIDTLFLSLLLPGLELQITVTHWSLLD